MISYDGRRFHSIETSAAGDVGSDTIFDYHQIDDLVWATYSGGAIRFGTLVATATPEGELDMRYQHVNEEGVLCTGECRSRPEVQPDGRIRLYESWRWTGGREGAGESTVEEIQTTPTPESR